MAKVAQKMKQAEITEQDSLLLTRNLLRIAIFNISYIRGLFPENYFNDKEVSALDMKVKKLMPIDDDSRRLIDWMEKGVYDALQKKYLKTLLFCICESVDGPLIEEYEFSFTYSSSDNEDVSMNVNRRGNKKHGATFKSNSNEITPEQMRFSACKMVRTLIQLMRTLDQMPDERTILMKLLYYDDVTPEDYEPPFFRKSSYSESNKWTKDPLNMDVGNINSKHHALSLKVKSVLDPCEDENDNDKENDKMSMETALEYDSASENNDDQSQENQYIVEPVGNRHRIDDNSMTDDEDTQNSEVEEENTTRIRNWILSRAVNDISLKDIHMNFQDISLVLTEEIVGKLLKEGLISNFGRESYTINREKDIDHDTYVVKEENDMVFSQKIEKIHKSDNEDYLYAKALYHTLPMDYVTVSKLQSKLEGVANQATVRKLIKKMETDGFIESKGFGKLGKPVIHSDFTNNKLLEIKKDLENKTTKANEINDQTVEFNGMAFTHSPGSIPRNGSTCAALHSFGSEFTRTRVLSDRLHNTSLHNGQPSDLKSQDKASTPTSRPEPISSLESGVSGIVKTKGYESYDRIPREADVSVCTRSIQDKRIRKIDSVVNPILQYDKRQKNHMA